MAENSKIEWTDHTFNPWRGCTKVSPGCANCYAEKMSKRNHKTLGTWGPSGKRVVASESMWKKPVKWNRDAKFAMEYWKQRCDTEKLEYIRPRVFCASLADVFEDWQGPMLNHKGEQLNLTMDDVRAQLFTLIDATPFLDWILVTKRPENIDRMVPPGPMAKKCKEAAWYRNNVWLLTSVENQEQADKRIPELLKCRDMSPVLGLSCEPLLGPVDFTVGVKDYINGLNVYSKPTLPKNYLDELDWVIVGGESGPNARPIHPDWARSLRDQCAAAGVPYFFKQWGEWAPATREYGILGHVMPDTGVTSDGTNVCWIGWDGTTTFPSGHNVEDPVMAIAKIGKKRAGRMLDGKEWNDFPTAGVSP